MNGIRNYILILILFTTSLSNKVFSKTIIVEKNTPINSIRFALSIAKDGDTVIVKKNIYQEDSICINKKISLIGNNFPVLIGNNKNHTLLINASGVTIKGFVFKNAGVSFLKDNSAIKLENVSECIIQDNKFIDNFFAIYLANVKNCKIINNEINSHNKKQTSSGNGIHLWNCSNILIERNKIEGHRDGIYLEFVKHSQIIKNISKNNLRYGLHFMFSDSCIYKENNFEKNKSGVAVMFTKSVKMESNIFENNWSSASYGILLKEIYDGEIIKNTFRKNTCGIYFESCNRITVKQNNFIENGWAIKLMTNSMDNFFTKNNFIENTFDVSTNSSHNFNSFQNNYWSKYNGYDLNKDNIGDIPYRPVKLFSYIISQNPVALILLRSFIIDILDYAEKIIPTITPINLTDESPSMKRIYDKIN